MHHSLGPSRARGPLPKPLYTSLPPGPATGQPYPVRTSSRCAASKVDKASLPKLTLRPVRRYPPSTSASTPSHLVRSLRMLPSSGTPVISLSPYGGPTVIVPGLSSYGQQRSGCKGSATLTADYTACRPVSDRAHPRECMHWPHRSQHRSVDCYCAALPRMQIIASGGKGL